MLIPTLFCFNSNVGGPCRDLGVFGVENGGYSYGFNGMESDDEVKGTKNSLTSYWRQYDPRVSRWLSIDPKKNAMHSPYSGFGNNPNVYIDREGDTTFLFHYETGKYMGMIELKKPGVRGLVQVPVIGTAPDGSKVELAKKQLYFDFADPINDPKEILNGNLHRVVFVENIAIQEIIKNSGAKDKKNHGVEWGLLSPVPKGPGIDFLKSENSTDDNLKQKGTGKLDFKYNADMGEYKQDIVGDNDNIIGSYYLFIPVLSKKNLINVNNAVAHNPSNFGNFLFGAAASEVGAGEALVKLAAHINNFFNDTYGSKGGLDSADDQKSLGLGVEFQENYNKSQNKDE